MAGCAIKGRDKAQWLKFTALPNLIYTDACERALYRSGVTSKPGRWPARSRWRG